MTSKMSDQAYASLIAAMPTPEQQWDQTKRWVVLLERAGYFAELHSQVDRTEDTPYPFDLEWRIFGPGWNGPRVASIDIDGCGASWHGPDGLWLAVIGPSEGVTD